MTHESAEIKAYFIDYDVKIWYFLIIQNKKYHIKEMSIC